MFGKWKSNRGEPLRVLAPLAGRTVPVTEVSDPTFSDDILGRGIAIQPSGGRVVAPANGTVSQMFDTGHAMSMVSDEGMEILVHVGLDTVALKGQHFTIHAHTDDVVKAGDLLMEFDLAGIVAAGYDPITPIVICNPDEYGSIEMLTGLEVEEQDEIILIQK